MKVQFKDSIKQFDCSEPIEQKIFKSGMSIGWAIMFHITADVNSVDIDRVITPESISELSFTNDNDFVNVIKGYTNITACVIRHKATSTVVELQLTKIDEDKQEAVTEQ